MTGPDTTLDDLIARLQSYQDAALVFSMGASDIGPAYHVTELKMIANTSVDCGGNTDAWQESVVQLLDGGNSDDGHMKVSKFLGIISQGRSAVPGFGEGQLLFEFALGNSAMTRSTAVVNAADASRVVVTLSAQNALCKPAAQWADASISAETGCCGGAPATGRCCAA